MSSRQWNLAYPVLCSSSLHQALSKSNPRSVPLLLPVSTIVPILSQDSLFPLIRSSRSPARLFWNSTLIIVLGRQERKQGQLLGGHCCRSEASVASFSAAEMAVLMGGSPLPAQRVREDAAPVTSGVLCRCLQLRSQGSRFPQLGPVLTQLPWLRARTHLELCNSICLHLPLSCTCPPLQG